MQKAKPLWQRLYFDQAYTEVARLIGYRGMSYRDMMMGLEPLEQRFGKERVHSAAYHVVTFEGQMTCNPKPLVQVTLRPEVRQLCWQLLGPASDQMDAFTSNANGSLREPQQKMPVQQETPAKKERQAANKEAPTKKARKKKTQPETPTESPAAVNQQAAASIVDQYRAAKAKHPEMLLLFRVGDFYELFDKDAKEASEILGLTLTTRDQTHTMAGFPHHSLEMNLQKLLKEGKRVAICELAEDSPAKKPNIRSVRRVQ